MKKFSLALLALAAALAITPAVKADTTYYYDFSEGRITASGMLSTTQIVGTDVYQATDGTINLNYGYGLLTGVLDTNPADMSAFQADNKLYPSSDWFSRNGTGLLLDLGGLLFNVNGTLVNMWGGNNQGWGVLINPDYSITEQDWVDYPGTFEVSTTPEPGSLFLLGTGLLGLGFLVRRQLAA
jgi:hypothetical protein